MMELDHGGIFNLTEDPTKGWEPEEEPEPDITNDVELEAEPEVQGELEAEPEPIAQTETSLRYQHMAKAAAKAAISVLPLDCAFKNSTSVDIHCSPNPH